MDAMKDSKSNSKEQVTTVYVGNIPPDATEELLSTLFSQFGCIKSCKMLTENGSDNTHNTYAFVEYNERKNAAMAISALTGRVFLGSTIRVNWANSFSSMNANRVVYDKSKHYPIFVGDVSNEVTENELRSAFSRYGIVSDCRIMRDPVTSKSRNFGFVTFVKKEAAEQAITSMNGFWIGSRSIRTNWAHKRAPPSNDDSPNDNQYKPSYDEVDNLTSPMNSTIFCGNIKSGLSESFLRSLFSPFGAISRIRVFPDKGYGFVNFMEKPSAVQAIVKMNQTLINNDIIRVSWGKEQSSEIMPSVSGGSAQAGPFPAVDYVQYLQYQQACAMYMQQPSFYQANAPATSYYLPSQQYMHSQAPVPLTTNDGGALEMGISSSQKRRKASR